MHSACGAVLTAKFFVGFYVGSDFIYKINL